MSELTDHIERLEGWLRSNEPESAWESVLIGEECDLYEGSNIVSNFRESLSTIDKYEDVFSDLLSSGYSWLNLSAVGVINNSLVVCVEKPNSPSGVEKNKTSVNLSGRAQAL